MQFCFGAFALWGLLTREAQAHSARAVCRPWHPIQFLKKITRPSSTGNHLPLTNGTTSWYPLPNWMFQELR